MMQYYKGSMLWIMNFVVSANIPGGRAAAKSEMVPSAVLYAHRAVAGHTT